MLKKQPVGNDKVSEKMQFCCGGETKSVTTILWKIGIIE